jgi:hypothetical protein
MLATKLVGSGSMTRMKLLVDVEGFSSQPYLDQLLGPPSLPSNCQKASILTDSIQKLQGTERDAKIIINELITIQKETVTVYMKHYPIIYPETPRKTNFCQNSQ